MFWFNHSNFIFVSSAFVVSSDIENGLVDNEVLRFCIKNSLKRESNVYPANIFWKFNIVIFQFLISDVRNYTIFPSKLTKNNFNLVLNYEISLIKFVNNFSLAISLTFSAFMLVIISS
jgi:hypothetical protein